MIPLDQLLSLLQAFDKPATFKTLTGKGICIALSRDIFNPKINCIHTDLARCFFDDAVQRKFQLRRAVSPHRTGGRQIGVNGSGMVAHRRSRIKRTGFGAGGSGHRVPVRSIRTVIGQHIHVKRHQLSVFSGAGPHPDFKRVPGAGGNHALLTRKVDLDRSAPQFHGQESHHGLEDDILFGTESAADVRFDNPNAAPGQTQCLSNDSSGNMGNLG